MTRGEFISKHIEAYAEDFNQATTGYGTMINEANRSAKIYSYGSVIASVMAMACALLQAPDGWWAGCLLVMILFSIISYLIRHQVLTMLNGMQLVQAVFHLRCLGTLTAVYEEVDKDAEMPDVILEVDDLIQTILRED